VALIAITSNRGLCGAFNANLIREARTRIAESTKAGVTVDLHLVGKKGIGYFRFVKQPIATQRQDIGDRPKAEHATEIVQALMDQFEKGELDAVDIVFAKFNSALSTPPTTLRILPVAPPAPTSGAQVNRNYLLAPSADEIVGAILPLYVRNAVYRALVETAAAEHGARRTAMKNATDSAGDMIDLLRRTYNRARQAQITQELAEIVGGAEALKG
jgi:F-type H+-transporting ATPase subunit gamma